VAVFKRQYHAVAGTVCSKQVICADDWAQMITLTVADNLSNFTAHCNLTMQW